MQDLNAVVTRINRITNSPEAYMADGVILVGHYHIDCAYGGVQLVRTCNTSGSVSNVLSTGHVTKRELYDLMHAFLSGIYYAQG